MASDYHEAESYAETSDLVPESFLDQIVILKVDTKQLDKSKLFKDSNVIDGNTTYEYHEIIPISALSF